MSGDPELIGPPEPPSPRSAKRKMMLITLAGILAVVGTLAGTYYFAMRPESLRIAVGPANSNDIKVVQALTQAFAQAHIKFAAIIHMDAKGMLAILRFFRRQSGELNAFRMVEHIVRNIRRALPFLRVL